MENQLDIQRQRQIYWHTDEKREHRHANQTDRQIKERDSLGWQRLIRMEIDKQIEVFL